VKPANPEVLWKMGLLAVNEGALNGRARLLQWHLKPP